MSRVTQFKLEVEKVSGRMRHFPFVLLAKSALNRYKSELISYQQALIMIDGWKDAGIIQGQYSVTNQQVVGSFDPDFCQVLVLDCQELRLIYL